MVELSIVIVVIGLLAAATMVGRDLLVSAQLKALISEIESHKIAVDNFQTQYENLPGDMPNATSFWTTAQNSGVAVKNGNGDGNIGANKLDYTEPYYAWNHLTLSKFVPGTFSGVSAVRATVGVNIPTSKYMDRIGFGLNYYNSPWGYVNALGHYFVGNFIFIGVTIVATSVNFPGDSAFTPSDAYYIDSKIDDGFPDSGGVMASGVANCVSGSAPNIVYLRTNASTACFFAVTLK